jgi:hypothetical protein
MAGEYSATIHIGDQWIRVPAGYVTREALYCENEIKAFDTAAPGPEKEQARQVVLDKRLEFWKLWNEQND